MSDDSNPYFLLGQLPKHLRRSRHWLQHAKQITLRNGKLVELRIATRGCVQSPLGQPPGHLSGQLIDVPAEPFGSDWTESTVEVRASSIQIDTKNEGLVGHWHSWVDWEGHVRHA